MTMTDGVRRPMSGRMKIHIFLNIVFLLFWFWPGGLLWNSVEPRIGGIPFNIIMWMIILPIINFAHMVYCFRWRVAEDKEVASLRASKAEQKSA